MTVFFDTSSLIAVYWLLNIRRSSRFMMLRVIGMGTWDCVLGWADCVSFVKVVFLLRYPRRGYQSFEAIASAAGGSICHSRLCAALNTVFETET